MGGVSANGDRDRWAAYAELVFPLLDGLELQVAGRYDDYSDFGGTFNPKAGLRWQAADSLVLRATASTGFKAPALHELYSGDIIGFDSVFDTTNCNAARAANDPVAIASYCGSVQEVMSIASGNQDLDAEESDHLSVGFGWSVTQSWELDLDYWQIKNKNAVRSSPQFFVDNEAAFAGNVVRGAGGDITMVMSPFQNIARQEWWGMDAHTSYRFDFAAIGNS